MGGERAYSHGLARPFDRLRANGRSDLALPVGGVVFRQVRVTATPLISQIRETAAVSFQNVFNLQHLHRSGTE